MKTQLTLAAAIAVGATGAYAGGMDRSGQSIAPLFEDGSYVELSFGNVNPSVSGVYAGALSSGNMAKTYSMFGFGYKRDLSEDLSFALIVDQPFGADVDYGDADVISATNMYPFVNSTATVESTAVNGVLRYKLNDRVSMHGGLRVLRAIGEVSIPAFSGYTLSTSTETDFGWLVGATYEIPDIALRASLTYNSEIDIDFATTEFGADSGTMTVTMPQSVNFDFQTGIAADTLLMFSARWAEWTATTITPNTFTQAVRVGENLVDHKNDTTSLKLGVGRRFNDKLSGSLSLGYEKSFGGTSGNLSPTDGYTSLTAGLKYQVTDQTAISGGVSYVKIGDATTSTIGSEFTDNHAVGFGLKLSHSF